MASTAGGRRKRGCCGTFNHFIPSFATQRSNPFIFFKALTALDFRFMARRRPASIPLATSIADNCLPSAPSTIPVRTNASKIPFRRSAVLLNFSRQHAHSAIACPRIAEIAHSHVGSVFPVACTVNAVVHYLPSHNLYLFYFVAYTSAQTYAVVPQLPSQLLLVVHCIH